MSSQEGQSFSEHEGPSQDTVEENNSSELEIHDFLDGRSSSLERNAVDFGILFENENSSSMPSDDVSFSQTQEDSQDVEMFQPSYSEDSDTFSSDEDGGEFTVSKYMESKLSRLDQARFGKWKVENPGVAFDQSKASLGVWEVAGTSRSSMGLPPLKLILKKSLQETPTSGSQQQPKREKRKYTRRNIQNVPKETHKRRGPGRPSTKKSTRQRLMKMFKKKYFKDRKRWARTKSNCSMPPTIRSIAKP